MSAKLLTLQTADGGTTLEQRRRISQIGFVLLNTHIHSLKYGDSNGGAPDILDSLSTVQNGVAVSDDTVYSGYDADLEPFPGGWGTDNRLWLQATAPRPCCIAAVVLSIEEHGKS